MLKQINGAMDAYWLWKTGRLYDSLAIAVPPDRCAKAGTKLGFPVEDVIIAGLTIVKFVHLSALMLLFGCGAFPIYAKKSDPLPETSIESPPFKS